MKIYIKEKAWVARLAAAGLQSQGAAIVFGKTIYLYGVSKADFLKNERWLRHEAAHILQYRQHGFLPFICLYVLESIKHGYFKNKFEAEARNRETDASVLNDLNF